MIQEKAMVETATAATAPAAKTLAPGVLATAKSVLVSPLFGIVALAGIVAFELWKGGRDARDFKKET